MDERKMLERAAALLKWVRPYSKAGETWAARCGAFLADLAAMPKGEMRVRVWRDDCGWWKWMHETLCMCCDAFATKDRAVADASRVADSLNLTLIVENENG